MATVLSLSYDEEAYAKTPPNERALFIYEWLRNLEDDVPSLSKVELKKNQKKVTEQLASQLTSGLGPATRQLLAKCFAVLYSVGDTLSLYETVNMCTDIFKSKDDSQAYLPIKLAAVACLGAIFEKVGRMVGNSCQEMAQNSVKAMKNAESQGRCEIMLCLQCILAGLGSSGTSFHRDIFKAIRGAMTDRSMPVRCAASKCALELIKQASFTYTSELDNLVSLCFRALDGSNYNVRVCLAQLFGSLMAATQQPLPPAAGTKLKRVSLEEVLGHMSGGFLRGGIGFLKASGGELLKSAAPREVRVGVTQAYALLFTEMGSTWVEKNICLILTHTLELLSSAKATQTHVDAVYSRRCVSFILRAVLGRLLDESAQMTAAKELCHVITKQMNLVNDAVHSASDGAGSAQSLEDVISTQHVLVCALQELGCLLEGLSTAALPLLQENILDHVLSVLLHPGPAPQLAAAWCLRCLSVAVPSQLTPLIDRCMERLKSLKSSGEAVGGYAHTLAALIGGVHRCPLGIPHSRGKMVFEVAQDLLTAASQNHRLALYKAKAGWVLLGALMTLGPSVVKHHLPRMMALWTEAFPKKSKETEQDRRKGDGFTWHVTLESRAGALCAMSSFIAHCPALLTEDLQRRLVVPVEGCLAMLTSLPQIIKQHGNHLKATAAMIRLRLYSVFSLLPPKAYEGLFSSLLRTLVSEFTLAETPGVATTSLLRSLCHKDDSILLGSWLQDTDHKPVEEQLQSNIASGSGSLEHDPACIFQRCPEGEDMPGPLPLGVCVIDGAIRLFGLVFPTVALKHRNQLLVHFTECIKQAKSNRQQAIQTNILTACLCALKGLGEAKTSLGDDDVRNTATNLVLGAVTNADPTVRCAAGEALGRIAQVVGSPAFTTNLAQKIFEQLKSARDAVSRTGHSMALGCLHRYVGGMGSGHHLNSSVSILLALAQDNSSTIVQVWALHALSLIADCGGPMFRSYVEPTLSQVITLVMTVPPAITEVHQCLGKCLAALITSIGPELQGTSKSIKSVRLSCVVACEIMQNQTDSVVQAEAINCLQQLHVFAPRHVKLGTVVRRLCANLSSPHLLLRRATVACLRQLSQREAREVCEHAMAAGTDAAKAQASSYAVVIGDKGLEGALFGMLDTETDLRLRSGIHDTLASMLQTLAPGDLTHWLGLCRDVLSAAKNMKRQTAPEASAAKQAKETDDDDAAEEDVDEDGGMTLNEAPETHPKLAPRWPTRVFATECVRRIVAVCEGRRAHFDLQLARQLRDKTGEDFLVMHLQELVRMAFIAATASSDRLKLEGLKMLQDIVRVFAAIPDPDYPGHVILEQFQAQVGAALRPAFAPDVPSDVTAMACEVCSAWIASGIARDLNDVRRIQQLLVTKLSKCSTNAAAQLYNEAAATMEKLAVLKAWAEVYIVAMKQKNAPTAGAPASDEGAEPPGSLLELVAPELTPLSKFWLGALRDHALLSLSPELASQLPLQAGMFYSPDSMDHARPHYRNCWPSLVHAAALWLSDGGFEVLRKDLQNTPEPEPQQFGEAIVTTAKTPSERLADTVHLLVGICMESLCSPRAALPNATVLSCLHTFYSLLDSAWSRNLVGSEQILAVEMLNVLHRVLLTRDSYEIQQGVVDVVSQLVKAALEALQTSRCAEDSGGDVGEESLRPGESLVYGVMEVSMCVLTRHVPGLLPQAPGSSLPPSIKASVATDAEGLSEEASRLVSSAVSSLAFTPGLCAPHASVTVLPSVLYLLTCVLRRVAHVTTSSSQNSLSATLQALKVLATSRYTKSDRCSGEWIELLQSALATILCDAKASAKDDVSPGAQSSNMDDSVVVLALAIFILSAPKQVILAADLAQQCIAVFKRCLKSSNAQLQLKALQTLATIFQCPEQSVAVPFIHALAPDVLVLLNDKCLRKPASTPELDVCTAAVKILQILLDSTQDTFRVHMLGLTVPILIGLLSDCSTPTKETRITKSLHEHCLQKLMAIGPKYPLAFKAVMAKAPELKQRLENAVRSSQVASKSNKPVAQQKATPAQPSIKLRMDFSNFK